jgi:hypothetical protein
MIFRDRHWKFPQIASNPFIPSHDFQTLPIKISKIDSLDGRLDKNRKSDSNG